MRSVTVTLPDEIATKLAELSRRDYRTIRHEAAVLLVDAVQRAARREGARERVTREGRST